jgi:NDP-sugar pyrophosphorylase family protein
MQILIPMAGPSPFFPPDEYFFPKSLIEVAARPMIQHVIENLRTIDKKARFIFVIQQDDVRRFSLDRTLKLLAGEECTVVCLEAPTRGALCSALMAVDTIDLDSPLVVANGDQLIADDLSGILGEFRARAASAGVVVFDSVHPRWSYVDVDDSNRVLQAAEKRVISRNAIAGLYYFNQGLTFVDAAKRCIENNASVDGQFYIAPCLNEIILDGGEVVCRRIRDADFHSFYSPEKIHQFEDEMLRRSFRPQRGPGTPRVRVVIPAAGEGSRFRKAGFQKPKPFIDVLGLPMIEHVIRNVAPVQSDVHLLLRAEHVQAEPELVTACRAHGHVIHEVDRLTEGTACTLLLARKAIDNDDPLLVANSDQYVDFDVSAFVKDCMERDLDGSILVFRDPTLNPKWSFAQVDGDGRVIEVAEKKPISDLATVGIYLFRRGADFVRGAIDMISRNDRVNGEFYTCPVYNYLIANGLRIGVYEVPLGAMHGLGTPEDLQAFLSSETARVVS